jgi:plasmid stabilization system protein ParE
VDDIASYIARDSARYAAAVVASLRDLARTLRQFPLSGRMVPELADETVREKLVYGYRLVYRVGAGVVTIAAVIHARQSFDTGVGRLRQR